MEIKGKPTVHPVLFITGKLSGYFTWFILLLALAGAGNLHQTVSKGADYISFGMLILGWFMIIVSSVALGKSIRIGLPTGETTLRTGGIYRFSRNPMYVGMHIITLAAIFYTLKWWVVLPALFSFFVIHLIILGEERFLSERFKSDYDNYRHKVRRYF